ncbi:MAG: hypothetical protein HY751_11695 [Nitrospinae bacterium]|nr:hypothetical protein [Nitrospinota bacterium]
MKKWLNNPLVVGALALIAFGVVFRNVVWPIIHKEEAPGGGPSVTSAVTSIVTAPFTGQTQGGAPVDMGTVTPMDLSVVGWEQNPTRDPFTAYAPVTTYAAEENAPPKQARDLLILKAIVVEPGLKMAYINKKIVKEGDIIDNYKILRISPGMVLVSGPLGKEELTFSKGKSNPPMAPASHQPASAAQPEQTGGNGQFVVSAVKGAELIKQVAAGPGN